MIPRLLWQDRAISRLPIMLLLATWFGYLWSIAWQRSGGLTWVDLSAVWVGLMVYLSITKFHVRTSVFEMALPVAARRLWGSRVLVRILCCVLFLAVGCAFACYRSPHDGAILTAATHMASVAVLVVVVLFAPSPKQHELPVDWRLGLFAFSVTVGAVLLSRVLTGSSVVYAAAPLSVAGIIGFALWRSVPATFELVPREPGAGHAVAAPRTTTRSTSPLFWSILRMLLSWEWWLVLAMILVFGAMPGAAQFTILVVIILPAAFLPVIQSLPALAHLPVSRRLIFACGTLPGLLAWGAGLAIGRFIWASRPGFSLLATFQPGGPETLRWVHFGSGPALTATIMLFCAVVWLAGYLLQMERCVPPPINRLRKPLALTLYGAVTIGALILVLLLDEALFAPTLRRPFVYSLLQGIHRFFQRLPPNPYLIATLTVALVAGAYRLAEARFQTLEVPTKKQVEEV